MKRSVELKRGDVVDDRFVVRERHEQSQHGIVYRVEDRSLGGEVALHTLSFDPPNDFLPVFEAAVQAARARSHPSYVGVVTWGTDAGNGVPWAVTRLVTGPTLAKLFEGKSRVPPHQAVDVARQLLSMIPALRADGIDVDFRPEALRLDLDAGKIYWEAFSIQEISYGGFTGIPSQVFSPYMAPESLDGESSQHSDVYVVGGFLYRLLSGSPPIEGDSAMSVIHSLTRGKGPRPLSEVRPDLPIALTRAVEIALRRDPAARHADAEAFLAALG